eukprot:CAMPEP_0184314426 /NCGR_PEP_ID=MMETSP1049-20130417/74035_1 /TAXON_ID=77928 /ORGANISM="Proteomonas sulcata, Strain CCMP704" /LENGTH=177 /DNA_ID=CAMNT_0026632333 /DNA_START=369 /DNA_END=902 /DNA_ORIENTATION=+
MPERSQVQDQLPEIFIAMATQPTNSLNSTERLLVNFAKNESRSFVSFRDPKLVGQESGVKPAFSLVSEQAKRHRVGQSHWPELKVRQVKSEIYPLQIRGRSRCRCTEPQVYGVCYFNSLVHSWFLALKHNLLDNCDAIDGRDRSLDWTRAELCSPVIPKNCRDNSLQAWVTPVNPLT